MNLIPNLFIYSKGSCHTSRLFKTDGLLKAPITGFGLQIKMVCIDEFGFKQPIMRLPKFFYRCMRLSKLAA